MGQVAAKAKQGAEQATQKTEKDGKVVRKSKDVTELINFMGSHYDTKVKPAKSFDEFYHAIYEIIQLFCQERGQLQYKIPTKEELEKAYEDVLSKSKSKSKKGQNLTRDDFMSLTEKIVRVDSFTFGRAAIDVLMVLFGAPVCALLAKRVVPGLKSFSDDVVIPVATSGAVVYLAKMNKL